MNNQESEKHLLAHDVRPTAVRIVVWSAVTTKHVPFTLKDVEAWLPYMDRSSIFRALRLFAEKQLLHDIDDGTGITKYCVCHCDSERHLGHVHFVCQRCGKAECLTQISIPSVELPAGFQFSEAEYIVKGVCAGCACGLDKS